jgi:hypothetical protein
MQGFLNKMRAARPQKIDPAKEAKSEELIKGWNAL